MTYFFELFITFKVGQLTWYNPKGPKQVGFDHCGTKGIGRMPRRSGRVTLINDSKNMSFDLKIPLVVPCIVYIFA
jgi:hypothetical protein